MGSLVGQDLGHYHLKRLLGQGGFAEVYLGEHLHLGTDAAIKVLRAHLGSAQEIEAFRAEARTIAQLKHPNIIGVSDFGLQEGIPYLVMAYASAGTLRQRHPKGSRLELATIIPYVRQVASALQYAHERKLIHRDVKPENMLLGEQGEVVLSDFGIAIVSQSSRYDHAQDTVGTISYMAPEQIRAHPRPASDQYALGVVVYEWLSGERPFTGSFTEIAAKHCLVSPPPLRQKLPEISPMLEQVVLRALAKDPKERFGSVLAFATALEQASTTEAELAPAITARLSTQPAEPSPSHTEERMKLENEETLRVTLEAANMPPPTLAVPPLSSSSLVSPDGANVTAKSLSSGSRPLSRRGILVGLTALAVTGGGVVWWMSTHVTPTRTVVVPTRTPATPTRIVVTPTETPVTPIGTHISTYTGHSGSVNAVAWSPDGKRIASGSDDTTVQVWNAVDSSHPYTYRGHPSEVYAVAWSPDGKRIASGGVDATVQVWNAANGSHPYTYRGHNSVVSAVAWSPDGKRIASGSYDSTVQIWNAADGTLLFTYRGHTDVLYAVAWSPDGKRIASSSHDKTAQVWNVADGSQSYTYRGHNSIVNGVAWSPDGKLIASGGDDKAVQVWNAADGGHRYTYWGHTAAVKVVAWSPDGKRIASGGWDATVQVWNAADGTQRYTYRDHSSIVWSVAWSPDGKLIASGSFDNTAQIWAS